MQAARPGECMDTAPLIHEIDYSDLKMRVTTDRYSSPEYHEREREQLWMRVWQVAGRARRAYQQPTPHRRPCHDPARR